MYMVSNIKNPYAKLLGIGIFLLLYLPCFAATKLSERYVMQQREGAQLFFIVPFEIPCCDKSSKPLSADITYLTSEDSVALKISLLIPQQLFIDSMVIISGDERQAIAFQTYFIEPEGKLFLHRHCLNFPFNYLKRIYFADSAFKLVIYSRDKEYCYAVKDKKWKEEKEWMCQLIRLIENNKRLMENYL